MMENNYLQHVTKEKNQLTDKIVALQTFITNNPNYDALPEKQRSLLLMQLQAMKSYQHILILRLDLLSK